MSGTPAIYDEDGRLITPRFAPKATAIEPNYLGYTADDVDFLVSCICTSPAFFHLRLDWDVLDWDVLDGVDDDDDGLTLCRRKRGPDRDGFWSPDGRRCGDCVKELEQLMEDCEIEKTNKST